MKSFKNSGQFKKGFKPWNHGKAKKFICKSCDMEFENRSHGKPKYCQNCLPKMKKLICKLNGENNKGKPSWNKGKENTWTKPGFSLSEEAKKKISLAKIGKPSPFKGKIRLELRGENNPRWRGGTGTERHQAMGKIEYRLWRIAVFMRDNYTCQKCDIKGKYLHADHIKPWALYPELRYAIDNGRTLCTSCHYFETFGKQIPEGIKWGVLKEVKKYV